MPETHRPIRDEVLATAPKNADRYRTNLAGLPIRLPHPAPYQTRQAYNQFVICASGRVHLKAYLDENGVRADICYPLSLHEQECFRDLGYRAGGFREGEKAAREVLAPPIHSALAEEDVDYVCAQIRAFYE